MLHDVRFGESLVKFLNSLQKTIHIFNYTRILLTKNPCQQSKIVVKTFPMPENEEKFCGQQPINFFLLLQISKHVFEKQKSYYRVAIRNMVYSYVPEKQRICKDASVCSLHKNGQIFPHLGCGKSIFYYLTILAFKCMHSLVCNCLIN